MPVRNRRPEDERPLFRAVNEQRLMGPVGAGSEGREETSEAGGSSATSQAGETAQEEKGPIAQAIDRAQENNWVYPSMANAAREKGLLDKADEILGRIRGQLGR